MCSNVQYRQCKKKADAVSLTTSRWIQINLSVLLYPNQYVCFISCYYQTENVRTFTSFKKKIKQSNQNNQNNQNKWNWNSVHVQFKCSCKLSLRPTSAPVLPLYQANWKMFVSKNCLWFPSGLDAAAVGMNGIFRLVVRWAHYHNGAATLLVRWHKTVKRGTHQNRVAFQWANAELLFAYVHVVISSIWLG